MGYLVAFLVIFGVFAFLALIAPIIRIFNKSKTTTEWFSYLLGKMVVGLAALLVLDIQLAVLLALLILVWGVAYGPLSWGENNITHSWYYVLIALSFIYFLLLLWFTGHRKFYSLFSSLEEKSVDSLKQSKLAKVIGLAEPFMKQGIGFLFPLMIIVGLVGLGITCFAAFTAALNDSGNISFVPTMVKHGLNEVGEQATDFYLWHFCNLIPQIKVTETLNWEVPFKYTDAGVGWLLLLFKSLMAYIVIARFYSWSKWRKESREKRNSHDERAMNANHFE